MLKDTYQNKEIKLICIQAYKFTQQNLLAKLEKKKEKKKVLL